MGATKIKEADGKIYALVPLYEDGEKLESHKEMFIRGPIDTFYIVSVPPETTQRTCVELQKELEEKLKKDVLVFTNNIKFLRASPLSNSETKRLMENMRHDLPDQP